MYKVGDKVKVISKEKFDELCGVRDYVRATKLDGVCHMTRSMARLCGQIVTIEVVDEVIECISVKASWEYEKTSLEDVEKFQNEATFILTESNDDVVIKAILGE